MSKRFLILTMIALAVILTVSACTSAPSGGTQPTQAPSGGSQATQAAAATSAPSAGAKLKIGFVTDVGRINDKSFNQSGWEGVQCAQQALPGTEIKYIETTDSKDYTKNIEQFADAGYDVVVTSGFGLGEPTYAEA